MKNRITPKVIGLAFLAMAGSLVMPQAADAAQKSGGDRCEQVFKQYRVQKKCRDSGCIDRNMQMRQKRIAAGCPGSRPR